MSQPDLDRRRLIKAIVKGVVYTSPIITSMAAPAGLMGQGPSGMMMMMFCDFFPTLCMVFGGGAEPGMGGAQPRMDAAPSPTPPPPTPPPPSQINPPPGR